MRRIILIRAVIVSFFSLGNLGILEAEEIKPPPSRLEIPKEEPAKPRYVLNAPLSTGAGVLGFGLGVFGGAILALPFCIFKSSSDTCTVASVVTVYAGGSLGMGFAIDTVSRKFGLRHDTFWSVMGGFIGNIPFAYLFARYRGFSDYISDEQGQKLVLSVLAGAIINLAIVYWNSEQIINKAVSTEFYIRRILNESVGTLQVTTHF